jgi:uncharacterized protein
MPITAYDATVTTFVRALHGLKRLLMKVEPQVAARGIAVAELFEARLAAPAPDMLSFGSQVHWAAEGAKRAIERLGDVSLAKTDDDAKTFAELYRHLDASIEQLQSVAPEALEAGLSREIEVVNPRGSFRLSGERFVCDFALPHFYFHVTCAYGILRHRGIELTMADFLARFDGR